MTDYMREQFFQVPRTTIKTSKGDVELPILYFNASCITAFFLCDLDKVHHQLADVPLKPGVVIGHKAMVGIAFYEYRETSIGPYNEVGVAISVVRESDKLSQFPLLDLYSNPERRNGGSYVIDLPVSTTEANTAGKEIWGLPKFVTAIPFQLEGRHFSSSVLDPESREPIARFNGKMGLGIPMPALHLKLFSYLEGDELATIVNVRRGATLRSRGSMKLIVGNSNHPMARRLHALGLNDASPVALTATNKFQSRMNIGVPLK